MKKAGHLELGKTGEDLAAAHLAEKGYTILHRNWRHVHEEIDIIAQQGDMLVMVEVKTRSTRFFGEPEQAVTPAKQKKLADAAEAYLEISQHQGEMRFDILAIVISEGKQEILHLEDAFYPFMDD